MEKFVNFKVALIRREAKLGVSGIWDAKHPLLLQSLLNYLCEVELCKKGGSRLIPLLHLSHPVNVACWLSYVSISRSFHSSLFRQEKKMSQILLRFGRKEKVFSCFCFVDIAVHFFCLLHSSSKSTCLLLDFLDCFI